MTFTSLNSAVHSQQHLTQLFSFSLMYVLHLTFRTPHTLGFLHTSLSTSYYPSLIMQFFLRLLFFVCFNSLCFVAFFSITIYPPILFSTSTHRSPPQPAITTLLSLNMSFCFDQSLHSHLPSPHPELSACSLSMSLSLFCLLVQFVH